MDSTILLVSQNYIRNHIKECWPCIRNKIPRGKRLGELHPISPPQIPFERVGTYVSAPTRFIKLYAVQDTTTRMYLEKIEILMN